MINANELRIGNLIKRDDHILRVVQIREIAMFRVEFIDKTISSNEMFIEHIVAEPILLAEEILLKCGFKKLSEIKYYIEVQTKWGESIYIELSLINKNNIEYDIRLNGVTTIISYTKYLHRLQNFIFELTQKDFKIEL